MHSDSGEITTFSIDATMMGGRIPKIGVINNGGICSYNIDGSRTRYLIAYSEMVLLAVYFQHFFDQDLISMETALQSQDVQAQAQQDGSWIDKVDSWTKRFECSNKDIAFIEASFSAREEVKQVLVKHGIPARKAQEGEQETDVAGHLSDLVCRAGTPFIENLEQESTSSFGRKKEIESINQLLSAYTCVRQETKTGQTSTKQPDDISSFVAPETLSLLEKLMQFPL
ncbi:MAG TPA: hypothetical protein VJC18_10370, partial [bacterium]|nr:hypothetical protein [bacterium]